MRNITLCGLFSLAALAPLAACHGSTTDDTGTVQLNLVGQSPTGNVYRLRHGNLVVQGPASTTFWDTEGDPDTTVLSENVVAGAYSMFLEGGWFLEKVASDGTAAPVDATLTSPNPLFFDVYSGSRTIVPLHFHVGDGDVDMGQGYDVVIEVDDEGPDAGPGGPAAICASNAECGTGQTCCIAGFLGTCQTLAPGQACPLPDLTISYDTAVASLSVEHRTFPTGDCAIAEGCVDAAGDRRLLSFSTQTPNVGPVDMVLGDPSTTPGFEFSSCHNHYHFEGYANYELLDIATGKVAARGHKQAFCLLDLAPMPGTTAQPRYHCGFQGISAGWSDIYGAGLDCQWVDITTVAEGSYLLRITINPEHILPESNYDNNMIEVPVTIGPDGPVTPGDPLSQCPGVYGPGRDCGWQIAQQSIACTPGAAVSIGCGCTSGGTCNGDPVLRVCDGDGACTQATALASIDDSCGLCPQADFVCPASGTYTVLTGAYGSGMEYTCQVAP